MLYSYPEMAAAMMFFLASLTLYSLAVNWAGGMTAAEAEVTIDDFYQRHPSRAPFGPVLPPLLIDHWFEQHQGVESVPRALVFCGVNILIAFLLLWGIEDTVWILVVGAFVWMGEFLILKYLTYSRRYLLEHNRQKCARLYGAGYRIAGQLVDHSIDRELPRNGRILSVVFSYAHCQYAASFWLPQHAYQEIAWGLGGDANSFALPTVSVYLESCVDDHETPNGVHLKFRGLHTVPLSPTTDWEFVAIERFAQYQSVVMDPVSEWGWNTLAQNARQN